MSEDTSAQSLNIERKDSNGQKRRISEENVTNHNNHNDETFYSRLDEEELFRNLRKGKYRNIVVLTGAGVSTAAGVPDFRSPGGLFDTIRDKFGPRFPEVYHSPEVILSRGFVSLYPDIYQQEIVPLLQHLGKSIDAQPTDTHRFCAWLYRQGWLRRVYTQNVDGLHLHQSLQMNDNHNDYDDLIVECHGSVSKGDIVLYGDPLPRRFYNCCDQDFPLNDNSINVDLLFVFGTSLRVLPFSAIPNLAPKGCTRVLINRSLQDCMTTMNLRRRTDSENNDMYGLPQLPPPVRIGSRKFVTSKNLWMGREGNKRWRQLLVEGDCDSFVQRFFSNSETTSSILKKELIAFF